MPLLQNVATRFFDRLPKIISPREHAVIDYLMIGGTLVAAATLFRRNRTAGACAVLAAVTQAANAAMTDFPGGVVKAISFPMHGRLALGNATMIATLPKLMQFDDTPESRFFTVHSLMLLALIGLTDFTGTGQARQVRELEEVEA